MQRAMQHWHRLGRMGPIAIAAAVLPGVGALALYGRLSTAAPWLREHPAIGPFICAITFGLVGGVALAPSYALSALCGWSFGFKVGLIATLGGFLLAAMVGYLLGGAIDGGRLTNMLSAMPRAQAVRTALTTGHIGKVVLVVALLRVAPVAPFSLSNLAMAAAQVPMVPYALGTLIGMSPRTAVVVYAVSRLSDVDAPLEQEPWLLVSGAIVTIIVVWAIGWIGKKGLAQVTAQS